MSRPLSFLTPLPHPHPNTRPSRLPGTSKPHPIARSSPLPPPSPAPSRRLWCSVVTTDTCDAWTPPDSFCGQLRGGRRLRGDFVFVPGEEPGKRF
eukprot:1343751-Amorphochlora_amoeboformis.AAC.1